MTLSPPEGFHKAQLRPGVLFYCNGYSFGGPTVNAGIGHALNKRVQKSNVVHSIFVEKK